MNVRVQIATLATIAAAAVFPPTAMAATLTVTDACGRMISGTPTAAGDPVAVDSLGNITAQGLTGVSSYTAGFGQCDPLPADGKPVCSLSASQTKVTKGSQVTLFAKCTAQTDSFTWRGATQGPMPAPNPSTTPSISLTFPASGAYTYTVVGSRAGVSGNSSAPLSILVGDVADVPTCSLTLAPVAITFGRIATAQVICQPEATSFVWDAAETGAPPPPPGAQGDLTFTNFGSFTYKVAGVNAAGTGPKSSAMVHVKNSIVFRSFATKSGTGAMAFPAGTQSTDFLVLFTTSSNGAIPTPAGWTLRRQRAWTSAINTYSQVFTKVAQSDTNVTLSATNTTANGMMLAYSGVSAVGAVGAYTETTVSAVYCQNQIPSSLTPGSLVVGVINDRAEQNMPGDPSGFTSRVTYSGGMFRNKISDVSNAATSMTASFTQPNNNAAVCNLIEILP